ncbi:ribosome hibernation-promoting factor, HPF/YfiA family [Verrucomicrobiota bacterium sgz303538]
MTDTTTVHTPVHITAHNLSLSPPLSEFVRKKIGTVARFANDVLALEIVLRRNPNLGSERFSASARLTLPGRDIHSSASNPDLYVAVGIVAARLSRRLRKRKTRLSKTYSVRSGSRQAIIAGEPSAMSVPQRTIRMDNEWAPAGIQDTGMRFSETRAFVFRRKFPFTFTPVIRA